MTAGEPAEPAAADALRRLVAAYVARRPGWDPGATPVVVPDPAATPPAVRLPVSPEGVTIVEVVPLVPGRPGVVDVVAGAGGGLVHVVVGLRPLGDEARFLPGTKDPVLGLFEDRDGLAVAFDGLSDEQTATAVLEAVAGVPAGTTWARPLEPTPTTVGVAFDDRIGLVVSDAVTDAGAEWVRLLQALDTAGLDHLPAPLAVWRRGDRLLGQVRELLPDAISGRALALGSLRDLLAAEVAPEEAGADFAAEATALGAVCARLHLALDRSFGRWPGDVVSWSAAVAAAVHRHAPHLAERADVRRVLDDLATLPAPCCAIRAHGDLQLGRLGRTDRGWVLVDVAEPPGGVAGPRRSPLADVADMLWSFGHVAAVALADHDVGGGVPDEEARRRVEAWERRSRRAFIAGYLAEPGIASLVPADRRALRTITSAFELEQSVRRPRAAPRPA